MLTGVDELTYATTLVLTTGRVLNVRPVSAMLAAPYGSGKTDVVSQFIETDGVLYANAITPWALYQHYSKDIIEGNIHHVILPELGTLLAPRKDIRETTFTFFNGLMEEGVVRAVSANFKWNVGYLEQKAQKHSARCGMVACAATRTLSKAVKEYPEFGAFLSRILPIGYTYSRPTIDRIFGGYAIGRHRDNHAKPMIQLPAPGLVSISPQYGTLLRQWAEKTHNEYDTYGLRRYKHLESLCMANALLEGRDTVKEVDISIVSALLPFFSLDCKKTV